jgi:cysteine-rich repeat protein
MRCSLRRRRYWLALGGAVLFSGCIDWDALYEAQCGDGVVSGSEQCDDANLDEDDACRSDCRSARCGDGLVWTAVEECDDGNGTQRDGCSDTCHIERDLCGNGRRESVEQCDDGNKVAGDGCSALCSVEAAPESCGNGQLDPDEACDDADEDNGDACLNGCSTAACGDGFVWRGAEECDYGSGSGGEGCSRTCLRCSAGAFFRFANGHCYSLHATPSTFAEAVATCDALGGYLWTTTSAGEARDVNRAQNTVNTPLWLGYRALPQPGAWLTGESIQYRPWAPGEPSNASSNCALQIADASFTPLWQSGACAEKHAFVCESEAAAFFLANHRAHAYRLHTRARPWVEAESTCVDSGGHLVAVETAEEQNFLARRVSFELWLGGSRASQTSFRWVTGEPVVYGAFAKNQPDNAGGKEDCIGFTSSHAWNDLDCSLSRRFICEFE